MAKGDRTAQEVRELTRTRDGLIAEVDQLRKIKNRRVKATQDLVNGLIATTPKEIEQRLQECMMVVREAMEEMDKLAIMLADWGGK